MKTTIYFAENGYFFKKPVVKKVPVLAPQAFVGVGGLVSQGGRHQLGAENTVKTIGHETTVLVATGVLVALESVLGEEIDTEGCIGGGPGMASFADCGHESVLDSCPQKIEITKLDSGFCVKHYMPIDMGDLTPVVEGEEWKKKTPPAWAQAAINAVASKLGQSNAETLAFAQASGVIQFVREQLQAQ